GERDRDHAVLEGVGGVRGVVLDPDLAEAEALSQAWGADEGRQSGLEGRAGRIVERQEVRVAPDPVRSRLDLAARLLRVDCREVIRDLQWPEAALAHIACFGRICRVALLAPQFPRRHQNPFVSSDIYLRKKPLPGRSSRGPVGTSTHIFQALHLLELAPSPKRGGCRGFCGPVPPPLWMWW